MSSIRYNNYESFDNINSNLNDLNKARPALIALNNFECGCEIRKKLKEYNSDLHECLIDPIQEIHHVENSKNLCFKITPHQKSILLDFEEVISVDFIDNIEQSIKLVDEKNIVPIVPKNLYGDFLKKVYNRIDTDIKNNTYANANDYDDSFNRYSNLSSLVLPSLVNDDDFTYCQTLSTYLNLSGTNYALYAHSNNAPFNNKNFINNTQQKFRYKNQGENVDILVIDSGIDPTHEEFKDDNGNSRVVLEDWNLYKDDNNKYIVPSFDDDTGEPSYDIPRPFNSNVYTDRNGHGTFCASLIAGKTTGWASKSKIYAIAAIQHTYMMNANYFAYTAYEALQLALAFIKKKKQLGINRPTIINNSWGSFISSFTSNGRSIPKTITLVEGDSYPSHTLHITSYNNIVDQIIQEGGIMVSAAGNSNVRLPLTKNQLKYYSVGIKNDARSSYTYSTNMKYVENVKKSNFIANDFYTGNLSALPVIEEIKIGPTPNTSINYNSQFDNPMIIVGDAYPIFDGVYDHKNHKINERTGIINQNSNVFIKSYYSNYGPSVDCFASGYNVLGAISKDAATFSSNTRLNNAYGTNIGTSFSCPQVAGVLATFLNDNLTATAIDCKKWLYANCLSGAIAEFQNPKVEIDKIDLTYGTDFSKITSLELPSIRINNNYFEEVYNSIGYNNVTILNTLTANDRYYFNNFSHQQILESDGLIFVPFDHKSTYHFNRYGLDRNGSTIGSLQYMLSTYLHPDTIGINLSSSSDFPNNYPFLTINLTDSYATNEAILGNPDYDLDFLNNYGKKAFTKIKVFKKTNSGLNYLTTIQHPYNITGDNNHAPIVWNYNTHLSYSNSTLTQSKTTSLTSLSGFLINPSKASFCQNGTLMNINQLANERNFSKNLLYFKGEKFITVDQSSGQVFVYKYTQPDTFTLIQTISSIPTLGGVHDTRPKTIKRLPLKSITQSSDGTYLALGLCNVSLSSYCGLNPALSGNYTFIRNLYDLNSPALINSPQRVNINVEMKPEVVGELLPGGVQIYKWNSTRYEYLTSIISPRQLSFKAIDDCNISLYTSPNILSSYNFNSYLNPKVIFDKNDKLFVFDASSTACKLLTLSALDDGGMELKNVPWLVPETTSFVECYNINNDGSFSLLLSSNENFYPPTSSFKNAFNDLSGLYISEPPATINSAMWYLPGIMDDYSVFTNSSFDFSGRTCNDYGNTICQDGNGDVFFTNSKVRSLELSNIVKGFGGQSGFSLPYISRLSASNLPNTLPWWLVKHKNYSSNNIAYGITNINNRRDIPTKETIIPSGLSARSYVASTFPTYSHNEDFYNYPKYFTLNTSTDKISTNTIKFKELSGDYFDTRYNYTYSGVNYPGNITRFETAFNDGRQERPICVQYMTTHSSGNKIALDKNRGLVYFLKPDNNSPFGYKVFTIFHGFTNKYPFSYNLAPTSKLPFSWKNFYHGGFNMNNNSTCTYPDYCFFNTEDTFTVAYQYQDMPSNQHFYHSFDRYKTVFVTFKLNDLNFKHGDSNITNEHLKFNKNIYLNGHSIHDSPNLLLQSYPRNYIISNDVGNTLVKNGTTYKKVGYTAFPINSGA